VSDLERPVHHRPRRLAQWLNPTGTTKVHSLIDKVYERKNLVRAAVWIKREGASKGAPSLFLTSSAPIDSSSILPRALARDDLVLPVNAE
jgi:hypothetical protein